MALGEGPYYDGQRGWHPGYTGQLAVVDKSAFDQYLVRLVEAKYEENNSYVPKHRKEVK